MTIGLTQLRHSAHNVTFSPAFALLLADIFVCGFSALRAEKPHTIEIKYRGSERSRGAAEGYMRQHSIAKAELRQAGDLERCKPCELEAFPFIKPSLKNGRRCG